MGRDGHTAAQVAADYGCGWATVMNAVRGYNYPLVDGPDRLSGVNATGVDETASTAVRPRRNTAFVTGVVNLSVATARLLDVLP